MTIVCNIWMNCLELNWLFYDPRWMLQISEFVWLIRSLAWVVFNNFLLIDATDRTKNKSDQKRFFFAVSLYPLSFFANTPFNKLYLVNSPGCYVHVNPFENPNSYIINDPGFNLMICSVVFTYIAPGLLMIFFSLLLCTTRWTKVRLNADRGACPIYKGTL